MKKIFTKLFLLATLFLASINLSAQTYNGGTWYSLHNATEYKNEDNTFSVFSPTTGSLSFQWKKTGWFIGYPIYKLYVSESSDGSNYTQNYKLDSGSGTKQDSYVSVTTTVSENITHLKFEHDGGSLDRFYKDVKIPLKQHILIAGGDFGKDEESKSFGNVTIGNVSAVQTVKLRSFLTTDNITITSSNAAFRVGSSDNQGAHAFNVGANACASTNGASGTPANGGTLGDINLYDINIYFVPTAEGEYSGTITISDGTSSATISVSGTGVKKSQSVIWNLTETKIPKGKIIENAAKANSGNTVTYTTSNDTVIKVINDGTVLQAVGLGTAEITATVAENDEWFGASDKKTFTVTNKTIQTIAWNDNLTRLKIGDEKVTLSATVHLLVDAEHNEKVYSEERTARLTYTSADTTVVSVSDSVLTIVGEGETTLTAHVAGDENYEEASVVIPVKVRQPSAGCEDILLVDQPAEIEFFQWNMNEIIKDAITINRSAGVPDKLTFQHKGEKWGANYSGPIKAQQSTDGGNNWSDIAGSEVTPSEGQYNTLTVQLDRRATHIRFVRPKNGTGYHYVSGIVVTPAQYLETSVSSISENAIIGAIITKDITINYANMKDEVMLFNEHADVQLSTTGLGNDCGAFGTATIQVTIKPTQIGTITDEIVLADAVSGKQVRIPVNVAVNRNTQTITWEQDLANIHTTDNITLNAKAKTEVYYTSSDSTIAYADGKQLIINKYGHVTIKAVATQDEKYEQATVSKEITINTVRPTVSAWPTVEPIAYAQALTTDMLIGGEAEVEGYFDWNTELNQTLVPGTYDLAVRFIPTNANYYAPVDDGTVSVTINKSAQTIVWDDSFENITVTDSIVLTASAQTQVTYEVSDTELAYITENNVLYFTRGGVVLITAYASEDDYYLATETVRELTILPAKPNILVKPNATAITYGQTIGESFLEGGEASVLGTFNWLDTLAMPNAGTYWQYVRFTPDDQESFKPVDFQVEVHVNKATQTITWELTNFVMKVGDVLNLTAVATSGLEVTYTLDDDTYAEINNNVLTALQVGTVTVTASQDGTYVDEFGDEYTNYFAADPVSCFITIVAKDVNTGTDLTFPEVKATKIIRDGRLYIIRNGHTYNVNGQVVE